LRSDLRRGRANGESDRDRPRPQIEAPCRARVARSASPAPPRLDDDARARACPIDVAVPGYGHVGRLGIARMDQPDLPAAQVQYRDPVPSSVAARHAWGGHLGEVEPLTLVVDGQADGLVQTA